MAKNYDFSGWATKNDLKCADGRTIRKDAFKDNDGQTVPLVWNHQHNDSGNVLGHALLENRPEGVYAYCSFNDTEKGQNAKLLVQHGDITGLSIYANKLKQIGGNVIHGAIREVSLVLAGANPGAYIDYVIAHSDEDGETAVIYTGEDVIAFGEDAVEHSGVKMGGKKEPEKEIKEEPEMAEEKTVKDVFDTLTEEQKSVVYALIGQAIEDTKDDVQHSMEEYMKNNIFENDYESNENVLTHSEMESIITDGKRFGSLKESCLQHGITDIEYLFPDNKNLTNTPTFIRNEPSDWVSVVMNGVKHTPFSRIKMMFADIREDEARAKGFLKGNKKAEEVFSLLRRSVDPTTVYKLQKMHRDDVIDITDFDVVSWIKGEMRTMLDEELARAFLFGDGRQSSSQDHIDATKIIPAASDAALYTIVKEVIAESSESEPHALIRSVVEAMDEYQGSGNPIAFLKQADITKMLLMEDTMGHRLYKNLDELAAAMCVSKIVKVPASIVPTNFIGLVIDLNDYNVGADKGGAVNMFEDFDIDYNKQAYLIETRCSGALVKPYSAIALKVHNPG